MSTPSHIAAAGRSPGVSRRLLALLTLLCATAVVLVLVRWRAALESDQPAASASNPERLRFYTQRVKLHPDDVKAYIELGKLEESQEFYISALRRLHAARALGARDIDVSLPIGRSLARLARWDEARDELAKACALMPDNVEAAANLAGAFYNAGEAAQATKVLDEFVAHHRAADGASKLSLADLRRIMLCYSEAKDTRGAGRVAQDILVLDPADSGAASIAGHSLLAQGQVKEALTYLERAVKAEPDVAALCYNYGMALDRAGRRDEALRQFQRCVILNPNAVDAFMQLAQQYEQRKDAKLAAVALSNVALHSKSNLPILYRAGKANERAGNMPEANYWYSAAATVAGKYDEGLSYGKKLAALSDPNWRASGLLAMADAYKGLHRMPEYLSVEKQIASHNTADDALRLADAYEKCDLLDKQIEYLKRAMELDPKRAPDVHFNIAATQLRRGLRDEAERELEQAVAGAPQDPDYHTQLGNLYLARATSGNRAAKAVSEYEQAAKLSPKDHAVYQNLGIACAAANQLGRASAYLEHAIDLQPGYGPSYEELGRVYARMGDKAGSDAMLSLFRKYVRYDQLVKTLSARADQNKTDANAQIDLGDLLARAGDLGPALDRYAVALQLNPKDRATRAKYDRIVAMLTQARSSGAAHR